LLRDPVRTTKVPYYIDPDGKWKGFLYSPSMVREILNATGYFDPVEVENWDSDVVVPFGTSHVDWIW